MVNNSSTSELAIKEEIISIFKKDTKQVSETFRLMESGITDPIELLNLGTAANINVIYNHKQEIAAVVDGKLPNSASIARYASRIIKRLLRSNPALSPATFKTLEARREELIERAHDTNALSNDESKLEVQTRKLSELSKEIENAIYVYTFPTYYKHGVEENPDFTWLKVGATKNKVWDRLIDQNRQTSMPEDPIILRIYHGTDKNILEVEKIFHKTLLRMLHGKSSTSNSKSGEEWFATTEDSLDAIAELIGLEIERDLSL